VGFSLLGADFFLLADLGVDFSADSSSCLYSCRISSLALSNSAALLLYPTTFSFSIVAKYLPLRLFPTTYSAS
jgi:hypothetical protein